MGTDWVSLFDKNLCDEILSLDGPTIDRFVQDHWQNLDDFSIFRIASEGKAEGIAVKTTELMAEGSSLESLKSDLVHSLCLSKEEIRLDYWGCYAEVFRVDPQGSIGTLALLPNEPEQTFLLLLPEHVDLMLRSLRAHETELRVMSNRELLRLGEWKRKCETDPRLRIAYFFDF